MPPDGKFGGMRFFIGVTLVASALTRALPAQGTVPGWYMETKSITSGATTGAATERITRTWVSGGRRRMAGVAPVSSMFPDGTYSLVLDSTKALYFVSPSARTIRVMSVPGVLEEIATVRPGDPGKPPQYTLVGPGEDILGHHTTIYEMASEQRVVMPMSGATGVRALRVYRKIWLAADSADPVVRAAMPPAVRAGAGMPPGIELRSTGVTTTAGTLNVTVSSEVLALKLMEIDTSMFALPSDYTVVNMRDELRTMRANVDSMTRLMDKINPSFSADQRRKMDSLLGPVDTTIRRKP
jgi:hypothetical protein